MKHALWLFFLVGVSVVSAQTADCTQSQVLATAIPGTSLPANSGGPNGCAFWKLTWQVSGFSAATIALQGSQDGSSWTNINSSLIQFSGSNPTSWTSSTTSNMIAAIAYFPFVRVNVSSVTGSGTIATLILGTKVFTAGGLGSGGGGGCTVTLTGDVTGSGACTGITTTLARIHPYTVATLPGSPTTGFVAYVTDGASASDCFVGGGSNRVLCAYTGTGWVFPGPVPTTISGLTPTAIVTANTSTTVQTPSPTSTMDVNGNISTPGSVSTGAGSGKSGLIVVAGASSGAASWYAPAASDSGTSGYGMPTTPTVGDFLKLTGTITCPTFASGVTPPGTCYSTAWQAAGGGGSGALSLLETHTASTSAALQFTSCFQSGFENYIIQVENLLPGTTGTDVWLRFSTNGGVSYDNGNNYFWANFRYISSVGVPSGGTSVAQIQLTSGVGATLANWTINGNFTIYNPLNASQFKGMTGQFFIFDGTGGAANPLVPQTFGGNYGVTTAANAFEILMSSGNITSGVARCYGYSN